MSPFRDTVAPMGVTLGEPEAEYFASGCLGSTILNDYLESAEGCYYRHVLKDPDWKRKETGAMSQGKLVHLFAECKGSISAIGERVAVYPDTLMTASGKASTSKEAKAWERENDGLALLTSEEYAFTMFLYRRMLANPVMCSLLEGAQSEVTMRVRDPSTGLLVQTRVDVLQPWARCDIKTTSQPLDKIKYSIRDYGMTVQAALYDLVDKAVTKIERPHMWGFVQTVYPYEVRVVQATDQQLYAGAVSMSEALDGIAEGNWGKAQTEPATIEEA
jgi:hypothetical protein